MASQGFLPGPLFHSELGACRVSKNCQPVWQSPLSKHDMIRLDALYEGPQWSEESWKPTSGLSEAAQFVKSGSIVGKPVIIDKQDAQSNSMPFSFGIAEQCRRHEKILHFLVSGSDDVGGGIDLPMLAAGMCLHGLTMDMLEKPFPLDCGPSSLGAEVPQTLIYPSSEIYSHIPILQLAGDLAYTSEIVFHSEDRGLFSGLSPESKDILSIIAGYYLSKNSSKLRKQSVIPYFDRLDWTEARATIDKSTLILESKKFTPVKRPEKVVLKPSDKKKTNKKARERDLYRKNYFHACESLLSMLINRRENGKTAMLSLKKSGPELSQLLAQFSASIAGTGLAILFSVVCKVTYNKVPFCTSKLLNTGIGFGLFWLSGAVNKLRDTVIGISKNSGRLGLKEQEMLSILDRCMNEIFFRAITLMIVAVLRFT